MGDIETNKIDKKYQISKHVGSIKLSKNFKELRREFNKEMEREALS